MTAQPSSSPRRAIIDIGTNTVLLLVASRRHDGAPDIVRDEARIARLGRGVAASGRLDPAAVARTLAILADYRRIAAEDAVDELCVVATEGLRMARDRDDFLARAESVLGVPVRLLSGDEEARLSYLSVALEHPEAEVLRVLDIGGGSTELVVGRGRQVLDARSHPMGSVRLTEMYVRDDPPSRSTIEALEHAAREQFSTQPVTPFDVLYGLAGTVTTAAAMLLGLQRYERERVHGSCFAVGQVRALRDELASEPHEQRAQRPLLEPERADVIVAGLTILCVALEHCGARTLAVADRGLRYALL